MLGVSEQSYVWINRYLKEGDARGQKEERRQEHRKGFHRGRPHKPERSAARDGKSGDHAALVAHFFAEGSERDRSDEVGAEEAELHQRGLGIGKLETSLKMRHQDVVHAGQKPEDEE